MLWTLLISSAASANIVFNIFVADSFKSESLFFCCLLRISIYRNCLTILSSQSAHSQETVETDILISLLHSADTSQTHESEPVSSVSFNAVDISVNTDELFMLNMKNDCETECFSRAVRFFFCGHSISFHSERVFDVCLWSLKLMLSLFSFSANLIAWLLMMHLRSGTHSQYCFVISLM